MQRNSYLTALTGFMLTFGACSDTSGPGAPRIEDTTFAPALEVDLSQMTKTASGLYLQNLVVGTGEAAGAGNTAHVYYTGWLANGTQFDSVQPSAPPHAFVLGGGGVISGFGEGARGMRVGGRRKLIIPPSLGYGAEGFGTIPGNAILVFVIDLVDVD